MFKFLKKKQAPEQTTEPVPEQNAAPAQSLAQLALELLKREIEHTGEPCHIDGGRLVLERQSMAFTVGFDSVEERNGFVASHMYVWTEHPKMTEPVYEMCSGLGRTREDAVMQSVLSFIYAAYSCWQSVLKEEWCTGFTTTVQDRERIWHLAGGRKALTGNEPEVDQDECLWKAIGEPIKKYLGAPRCYWIKLYIGKVNGKNLSEVRINDIRIGELSRLLQEYADRLPIRGTGLYSEKQFFFVEQDESTYVPYPYAKNEVERMAKEALALKWQCWQEQDEDKYDQKLSALCKGDGMLFVELDCFMREMAAIYAYQENVDFGQEIFAFRDGSIQESYYATQFQAYPWIFQTMVNTFRNHEQPNDLFALLLTESAIGQMIRGAEEKGKPMHEVRGFGIMDEDHGLKVR